MNVNTVRVVRSRDGEPAESWPGIVTYVDATQSARFKPNQPQPFDSTLRLYTLTVVGDGLERILDVDGLALDGNGDGSPGGNFTSTFTVDRSVSDV